MTHLFFENGDLLTYTKADFIVQQCNCLTVKSHGLAESIARIFPDADTYSKRKPIGARNLSVPEDRGTPGSISIHKKVINMYAQWRPGRIGAPYFSSYPESPQPETVQTRQKWFRECLEIISHSLGSEPKTLAFPFQIGCGLAGGDWKVYQQMLEEFAAKNPQFKVVIITKI